MPERDDLLADGPHSTIPTQKDVARLAGVSPITVSRTLAGGKNVKPDVQQRVIEAVRQLDYLPNENARGLRPGQQSGLIGVAITNLSNPFYGTFALGVEEVAHEHGRYILLGSTAESASRESELVSNFLSRRVEGLIVIPAGEPAPRRWIRRLGQVPLVVAAREHPDLDADIVLLDDAAMARRATEELLAGGHRRLAFIGNIVTVSAHRARYEEARRVMLAAGFPIDPRLIRGVTDDVADATSHTRDFLDLAHPPTAIIAANNRIAVGVLQEYARRLGEGADPEGLPVLAMFDALELADLLRVRVRVYASDPRELGRTAAQALFHRLDGLAGDQPRRIVVPG